MIILLKQTFDIGRSNLSFCLPTSSSDILPYLTGNSDHINSTFIKHSPTSGSPNSSLPSPLLSLNQLVPNEYVEKFSRNPHEVCTYSTYSSVPLDNLTLVLLSYLKKNNWKILMNNSTCDCGKRENLFYLENESLSLTNLSNILSPVPPPSTVSAPSVSSLTSLPQPPSPNHHQPPSPTHQPPSASTLSSHSTLPHSQSLPSHNTQSTQSSTSFASPPLTPSPSLPSPPPTSSASSLTTTTPPPPSSSLSSTSTTNATSSSSSTPGTKSVLQRYLNANKLNAEVNTPPPPKNFTIGSSTPSTPISPPPPIQASSGQRLFSSPDPPTSSIASSLPPPPPSSSIVAPPPPPPATSSLPPSSEDPGAVPEGSGDYTEQDFDEYKQKEYVSYSQSSIKQSISIVSNKDGTTDKRTEHYARLGSTFVTGTPLARKTGGRGTPPPGRT